MIGAGGEPQAVPSMVRSDCSCGGEDRANEAKRRLRDQSAYRRKAQFGEGSDQAF